MKNKIKKITFYDVIGLLKFLIVILPALIYKKWLKFKKKSVWLICEKKDMARDNGFAFYKYMRIYHPDVTCFYAIDFKSFDYSKFNGDNNIINWSSLKHYFYYLISEFNISSHKEGNPNQTLFTLIHLHLKLLNNRVFLQHGVLYTDLEMFHKKNTYFKMFCTGAFDEYKFVKKYYGYDNEVKYTGLARFDDLHNFEINKHQILYIPTWRRQLDNTQKFLSSNYYYGINSLLNGKKLIEFLERNDLVLLFYVHTGFAKYKNLYKSSSDRIKIVSFDNSDIQKILKCSSLMITDFSSVSTDFAYMEKPIIYYQYDKDDFVVHEGNSNTYFSYEKDGFGPVVTNEDDLLQQLKKCYDSGFENEDIYNIRVHNFFKLHDMKNCERIFNEIEEMKHER